MCSYTSGVASTVVTSGYAQSSVELRRNALTAATTTTTITTPCPRCVVIVVIVVFVVRIRRDVQRCQHN